MRVLYCLYNRYTPQAEGQERADRPTTYLGFPYEPVLTKMSAQVARSPLCTRHARALFLECPSRCRLVDAEVQTGKKQGNSNT